MIYNLKVMKRKTFSILFYIRKFTLRKNEEASIYLRITVDGFRADASTNRSILPDSWSKEKGERRKEKGCAKPGTANYKELNHYLEHLRQKAYQAQKDLEDEHRPVTACNLRNKMMGLEDDNARKLLVFYADHNIQEPGEDYPCSYAK